MKSQHYCYWLTCTLIMYSNWFWCAKCQCFQSSSCEWLWREDYYESVVSLKSFLVLHCHYAANYLCCYINSKSNSEKPIWYPRNTVSILLCVFHRLIKQSYKYKLCIIPSGYKCHKTMQKCQVQKTCSVAFSVWGRGEYFFNSRIFQCFEI